MNILPILPEIVLFCGGIFILMLDTFLHKRFQNFFYSSHLLSLLFCAVSLGLIVQNFVAEDLIFNRMYFSNSYTSFVKVIAVTLLTLVIFLSFDFIAILKRISAEFLALLMIATSGGMILVSANDFLVFYLGLELQALSLYLLAAINRSSRQSSEAGMKYFILGCLASGILLFGISMIYGFSGTTNFTALTELYHTTGNTPFFFKIPVGVMMGLILVITAMFFKVAAAPFHMWSPDVYEGSPTIVTTFFATVVKLTTLMALVRLFSEVVIGWPGIVKIFTFTAILSLAVGSLGAIFQKNLKRLLAYSSIGHVGFIILGLAGFDKTAVATCTLYVVIYTSITIGCFAFLLLLRNRNSENFVTENEDDAKKTFAISSLAGLSKTNPVMAICLAVLMFSSAGVPPLAGFFSKFYILASAISHGFLPYAIIAILFTIISAFYYLRVVKVMYFDKPQEDTVYLANNNNIKGIILFVTIFNLIMLFFFDPIFELIRTFLG